MATINNQFDLTTSLASDIVCQKITGKSKQFVFIRDDYAYKGPYQQGRLNNVINRSQIFARWNTPCVVKAIDYITTKDGTFVRYPNIMEGYILESETYIESFSGNQYKIVKNPPVTDIGHAMPTNDWITTNAEDVILALCHCNVLRVGDMNVRNTMVDIAKRQFYIIDFDDNLGKDREDEVFYFSKAPAKKFNWYEKVYIHYPNVANRMTTLLTDDVVISNNLVPRIQRIISLLKHFSKINIVTIQHTQNIPPTQTIPTTQTIPPTQTIPIAQTIPHAQTIYTGQLVNTIQTKIGTMIWKGLLGGSSKTYSGVDFDIAKSALQKYIRRNMPQKAVLTAIELYRMGEVGGDPGVTNMYNRLAIIANEDIGPAGLSLMLEVTRIVELGDRDVARLVTMLQLMCEINKTRIMSHAWRAYANTEGRNIAIKMGVPVDTTFTESDMTYVEQNKNSNIFANDDPVYIRTYILVFLKRLHEKILTLILGHISLWKLLRILNCPKERNLYTRIPEAQQNAIMIGLYRLPYENFNLGKYVTQWKSQPVLHEMLNGNFTLEIDAFAIDKHTSKGRSMGMSIKEFVDDGATPNFHNELLESIYKMR